MDKFNRLQEKYGKDLDRFMPIVQRVHGPHHPEINEVAEVYQELKFQLSHSDLQVDEEFQKLRAITHNYQVPHDVCQTYAGIYQMLEELDQAYQKR